MSTTTNSDRKSDSRLESTGEVRAESPRGPNAVDLGRRVGWGALLRLAWPIMISMLSFTAMMVTDTLWVGRLGTGPLGAIGLATSVTYVAVCFAMGLLRGAKVAVAQATGAGDEETVALALGQGLWLAWALAAAGALAAFGAGPLLALMGAEGEVHELATSYAHVRLWGALFTFSMLAMTAWLEGTGDTRTPMVANLMANGLNIAVDPLLIFGLGPLPALGIEGAALATIGAQGAACLWMSRRLSGALASSHIGRGPRWALLGRIWRLGLPMGVNGAANVGAWAIFTALLAYVGEAELAAHVMVVRILSVSFLPGHAIGEAAGIVVGQAVGARRVERAWEAWRASLGLACALMGAWALIFCLVPELLLGPFEPSAEVLEVGRQLMLVAAAFQIFDAVVMSTMGVLNGAGDTRFVMRVGILCAWVVNLPLAWALALGAGLGAVGAWLGLTAEIVVLAVLVTQRVRGGAWVPAEGGAEGEEIVLDTDGLASAA